MTAEAGPGRVGLEALRMDISIDDRWTGFVEAAGLRAMVADGLSADDDMRGGAMAALFDSLADQAGGAEP